MVNNCFSKCEFVSVLWNCAPVLFERRLGANTDARLFWIEFVSMLRTTFPRGYFVSPKIGISRSCLIWIPNKVYQKFVCWVYVLEGQVSLVIKIRPLILQHLTSSYLYFTLKLLNWCKAKIGSTANEREACFHKVKSRPVLILFLPTQNTNFV